MSALSKMFGVRDIALLEPTFEALPDGIYTEAISSLPGDKALLMIDENDWPIALAVHNAGKWAATSFLLKAPSESILEHFEELGGRMIRTDQEDLMKAIREYYSMRLSSSVPPAIEDFSEDRAEKVVDLLLDVWPDQHGAECLDCGCGSGMGSLALRRSNIDPISYDNDPSLLSLGLSKGRLLPERTMCIDATWTSRYCKPCRLGLALMAGSINDFTSRMWNGIIDELLRSSEDTLITLETEKEALTVKGWCSDMDKNVDVLENDRDPFYDRWVVHAEGIEDQ